MNKKCLLFFFVLGLSGLVGCGSTTDSGENSTITIDDMSFSPTSLDALPGDTITVINDDSVSHTVTSESGLNLFDNSGEFDTGTLSPGETTTFEIPSSATLGDTLFFYCDTHEGTMDTPNGQITVN